MRFASANTCTKAGRKRAGHGHGPIRWIDHLSRELSPDLRRFGKLLDLQRSGAGAIGHFGTSPFDIRHSSFDIPAMIRRAIYPGSFDPVTNGHLDVIDRARKLFDEVIVAVAHNDQKHPLFTLEERLDLLQRTIGELENVEIAPLDGLLVDFAVARKATAVIRGLRAVSDFEFEFQMALMNRKLEATVETIFLMPKEEYTYLSSRIVKEIARLGGDVTEFRPGPASPRRFEPNSRNELRKDSP